jgi:hypothetical protein
MTSISLSTITSSSATSTDAMDTTRRQMQALMKAGMDAAAKALNMDPNALQSQLQSGKSLKDVAAAQGVDFSKVQSAMSDAVKPQLDKAVSAGQLTSSQASDMLSKLTSGDAPSMNKPGSGGGTNRVHHGGGSPPPSAAAAASSTGTSTTSAADQAKLDAAAALKKLEAATAEQKLEAAAAALKLYTSQLIEKLKSGESLKGIADAAGVDFSKVQSEINDAGGSGYSASGANTASSTGAVVDADA